MASVVVVVLTGTIVVVVSGATVVGPFLGGLAAPVFVLTVAAIALGLIILSTLMGCAVYQPLPPPRVNSLLNAAQPNLEPHLVAALKDAIVQELALQRRELLAGQQAAAAELSDLARRLEAVQTPMLERLRAYEQRILELEQELGAQTKENRELLKLKIEMIRSQLAVERRRVDFN